MKKIILIINNDRVRQLYHKILLLRGIEVIPISNLSIAVMLLNLDNFDLAIIDIDKNQIETEVFFKIRQNSSNLSQTRLVVLTKNNKFKPKINKNDIIIPAFKTQTKDIISQIEKIV